MKISLPRRHALLVEDCAFSHKIDYITICSIVIWMAFNILNLKGHPNCTTGSRGYGNFAERVGFAYWWSFSGRGSAVNGLPRLVFVPIMLFKIL